MSNPGVGVHSGGGGSAAASMPVSLESSRDGAAGLDFSGALESALLGIGQGPVPADQQQFADLLGHRLKTEDVLQGTLRHMFQKLQEQEALVGQLQQTVTDLETSHQPWPRTQFEELVGKVSRVGARVDTLPPDTALVTKKYLKEYDNQWRKRWNDMEKANEERFDRLETRLASFEEAVLRVELKIEHDMKQCLVELNKAMVRLDEVEENGRRAMLNGFERVERDISDLTLALKAEGERITEREVEASKTSEQLVDAAMEAEDTKSRLARVEGRLPEMAAEQLALVESTKEKLVQDICALNDTMAAAEGNVAALQSEAESMKTVIGTLEEGVMGAHGSLAQHAATIQQQASIIQALQATTHAAQEKAPFSTAQGAPVRGGGSQASSRVGTPGQETSKHSISSASAGAFAFTGSEERLGAEGSIGSAIGGGAAAAPPMTAATAVDGPGLKFAVQSILDKTLPQAIDDAMDSKLAELQDIFKKMVDKTSAGLAELKTTVEKRGRQLDTTEKQAKATAELAEEMKNDVEMLMGNVCLKEEQDRWRASIEGFTKDLEYFKKKYSRHLGLQVENYTVAGMAKEEDLAKLSANMQEKVSRKELQAILDRAVQRSMDMYSTMQRQQEMDRMVVGGTGNLLQSRCMACDRDMTMVGPNDTPSLGSGLLTAGARSLSPSKSPTGKSKGFLPRINKGSSGLVGPGLNPMEMKRLQKIAEQYEGARVEPQSTSPPTHAEAAGGAVAAAQESPAEVKEW